MSTKINVCEICFKDHINKEVYCFDKKKFFLLNIDLKIIFYQL
jgi:hypothetical protein